MKSITSRKYSRWCAASALLCMSLSVCAVEMGDDESQAPPLPYTEGPAWKEQTVGMPPWPRDTDLATVDVHLPGSPLRVSVDEPGLQIGDDGILRYVLVLESDTGTRTVYFEGMRCSTSEYRVYAFGSADQTWSANTDDRWQPIRDLGAVRIRYQLGRHYFCDRSVAPWPINTIRRNLHAHWKMYNHE